MKQKIFYGWWIVLATNIICMFGYGTWLYSFGVFFKPMSEEFGWTRAMTSGAYALRSVEGGIASPIVGWAVDKYGSRRLILIGAVIAGAAFVMMPLVNSLMGFYLIYGIVLSAGMSAMLYLPAWTVIAKWFDRRLSMAMAILSVGAGVGGLICAPLAAVMVTQFGWRSAFVVMGVFIWCVVIPLAFVVRERPEDMGLRPDGNVPSSASAPARGGLLAYASGLAPVRAGTGAEYTLGEALRSSSFWFIALAFFFQGMAHSTVTVHTIPALTDAGIPVETAAISIGLLTLVSIIGRLVFGVMGDHLDKRYLFMVSYCMMGLGMLVLMKANSMALVWLFIFLFGVGFGGNIPLMPAIRAEYFGRRALGKIQGVMNPVMMVAGAVGPILAGHRYLPRGLPDHRCDDLSGRRGDLLCPSGPKPPSRRALTVSPHTASGIPEITASAGSSRKFMPTAVWCVIGPQSVLRSPLRSFPERAIPSCNSRWSRSAPPVRDGRAHRPGP